MNIFLQKNAALIQKKETPFYLYNLKHLNNTLKSAAIAAKNNDVIINYAVKANSNKEILAVVAKYVSKIDTVSANEIKHVHKHGFKYSNTSFAGAGKTTNELLFAIKNKIGCLYIESLEELLHVDVLLNNLKAKLNIGVRINPNIDAKTHKYITTGLEENKNGIEEKQILQAIKIIKENSNINFIAIHVHVGSNILDLGVFEKLSKKMQNFADLFLQNKLVPSILNMGGGLGVNYYEPDTDVIDFDAYFKSIIKYLDTKKYKIHVELGRSLVAQSGTLISRVVYNKKTSNKNFLILDAGFTELIRPALYGAYHKIENLNAKNAEKETYEIVGPICESSDSFANKYELSKSIKDDIIAIRTAGAYGEVMASNYNLRKRKKTVYI